MNAKKLYIELSIHGRMDHRRVIVLKKVTNDLLGKVEYLKTIQKQLFASFGYMTESESESELGCFVIQVEKLWEHAFHQRLRAVPSERPILSGEASWSTAKERRGLMELMFEKFGVPAMFPAKNAMLSAFSAGRSTALVTFSFGCCRPHPSACLL